MEEKEKDMIDRNYYLLVHNIILTDEFYDQLRWNQVLPESMISDIQECKTREERTKHLLYTLKLRGCDSYRKFRHILHLTGHNLLADQLYEEDTDFHVVKGKDLFNKFPSVFNHISDEMKTKIIKYLDTKIMEKALVRIWNKIPQERLEALENKKSGYIQERELKVKLDNKRKQLSTLKDDLCDTEEKLKKKELEFQAVEKEREEIRKRFKAELAVQARFNAANNSSILRLREKFVSFNEKIRSLNKQISEFLSGNENTENDPSENVKLSRLEQNVKTVIHIVKEHHDAVESKANERESVLALLNKPRNKTESLADIVKKFIEKEEKSKSVIFKEIEKLIEILRKTKPQYKSRTSNNGGVDMKQLRNMVATVRVEVEHLKKKLEWKDDQITDLIRETMVLRQNQTKREQNTVSETLKGAIVASPISSPDSTYEMQVAYKKFDEYISQSPKVPDRNRRRGSLADVDLEPDPDDIDISYVEKPDYQPRVRFPEVHVESPRHTDKPSQKILARKFSLMSEKDLGTIFESNDNDEFERFVTHMVKKTHPTRLPLICKDAIGVDLGEKLSKED